MNSDDHFHEGYYLILKLLFLTSDDEKQIIIYNELSNYANFI